MLRFKHSSAVTLIIVVVLKLAHSEPLAQINPPGNKTTNNDPGPSGINRPPFDLNRREITSNDVLPGGPVNAWAKPLDMNQLAQGPFFDPHRRVPTEDNNGVDPNILLPELKQDFQRLVLVQSWRRASCSKYNNNVKLVDTNCQICGVGGDCNDWSLHGLWPCGYPRGSQPPENCTSTETFDSKKLKSALRKRMEEHWKNIFHIHNTNEAFWKHQWVKHGTCATQLPYMSNISDYITKTLDLFDKYKVKLMFNRKNINPSVTAPRPINDFHKALYEQLNNHTAKITCVDGTDTNGATTKLIHEVHICFSKHLQLENCPGGLHLSCGTDRIKYY